MPEPTELFRVELRQQESGDLLILAGQINLDAAALVRDEAVRAAANARGAAIDWSGAEYVSASAVQVLLALGAALAAKGQALEVANENAGVRRALEVAGLSGRFPVRGGQG
jgi:anti-anti-sigma factor